MIKISRPILNDAPSFCKYFFNLTTEDDLIDSLEQGKKLTVELFKEISPSKEEYRYADGKWSVKMVLSHIIDCERYYAYHAMCRSRKIKVEVNPFDRENAALHSNANQRTLKEIEEEYLSVREATIKLFACMTDEMLDYKDPLDKIIYTPRSLGWMAAGHNIHHYNMIKEKYLS